MQGKKGIYFAAEIGAAKLKMHAWNQWNTLKHSGFASEELILDNGCRFLCLCGISVLSVLVHYIYLKLILSEL